MKIYEIKHCYYVDTLGACDDQSENCGYYATKEIAMAHLEDEVAKRKKYFAIKEAIEKERDWEKQDELREAYRNGAIFEYIPAPNEKPMWFDENKYCPFSRYYPFAVYNENWEEWVNEVVDCDDYTYEDYLYERYHEDKAGEYYLIKEIEVIDA